MQAQLLQTRQRRLFVALVMATGLTLAGAAIGHAAADATPWDWGAYLAVGVMLLALWPLAFRSRQDARAVDRLAGTVLLWMGALVLYRVAMVLFSVLPGHPGAEPFRMVFHFLPFYFLAGVVLLDARAGLKLAWTFWAICALLTLGAVAMGVLEPERGAVQSLLLWVLLGNPLFILLLQSLPQYEAALISSNHELAERDRLLTLLADSERRFNLVVQSLHIGVWDQLHDADGRITRWRSSRFHELLGYLPGELDPALDLIELLAHPDDRAAAIAQADEQLAATGEMSVELRLRTQHQGYRWFRVRGKADHGSDGRIARVAGALTDIHDRRESEQQMRASQGELQQMAFADALTGIPNRRAFNDHFRHTWAQCEARGQPLALLLLDLDHFKAYNDRYGHGAGDACLARFARRLRSAVFLPDAMVARLGGEEFVVLLPDMGATAALGVAGRILELTRTPPMEHAAAPAGRVTVSIGVASTDTQVVDGPDRLLRLADRALYEVKARGRDGVFHVRGFGAESIEAA